MDVQSALRELRIPIAPDDHHHSTRRFVNIDCPHCSPDSNKYRLGISLTGEYANCWTCGRHSVVESLVVIVGASRRGVVLDLFRSITPEQPRERVVSSNRLVLPRGVEDIRAQHRRYLERRGYDVQKLVNLWGIRGIGVTPPLSWRVFIPIMQHGRMVSWTTRSICDDVERRYWTAKESESIVSRNDLLYGEDYCRHGVIICEGPLDVWKVGPSAVASLGTSFSQSQLRRLKKYSRRVIVFDSDDEAQRRALKLWDVLDSPNANGQTINVVLDSKDPGSATKREIQKLRKLID